MVVYIKLSMGGSSHDAFALRKKAKVERSDYWLGAPFQSGAFLSFGCRAGLSLETGFPSSRSRKAPSSPEFKGKLGLLAVKREVAEVN